MGRGGSHGNCLYNLYGVYCFSVLVVIYRLSLSFVIQNISHAFSMKKTIHDDMSCCVYILM